ncbi:McrB family protein [Acinetobacter shaoyimingii]|uniref:McrB family protein n=1 Tax=Acinetobacter shaoyimingii TaxID=2715164 RepID=UPI0014082BE4|nr:AAA family ATPase [Acinetobacter shaoyimingii]
MNIVILKQWFNDYVESGEEKSWRKDYESTFNKVQEVKQKLNNSYKLSVTKDLEFLSEFLKNDANGVASKGQSNLANDVFDKIIRDSEFLNVIENIIQRPTEEAYKALHSYGEQLLTQYSSTNRPLLFNRACASCTLDVSTLVDANKFNALVRFLNESEIITIPEEIQDNNWYVKNKFLVEQVKTVFKEELETGKTDLFSLNIFLWRIYDRQVSKNFNAKSAVNYLNDRYPNTYTSTKHIAAFKTSQGRELALDPKLKTPIIICDAEPPIELKLLVKKAYSEDDPRHHHLSTHAKSLMLDNKAYSIIVSNRDDLEKLCVWYDGNLDQEKINQFRNQDNNVSKLEKPLNRILFGAAGTGKTYNTINHALSIVDPEYDPQLDRKELKKKFDDYKEQGQIKFVTFHQSFSYEDFVEGIRADSDDNGQLSYEVKDGVFKEICNRAAFKHVSEVYIDKEIDDFVAQISLNEKLLETKTGVEFTVFNSSGKGGISVRTTTQNEIVISKKAIKNYLLDPSENIRSNQAYAWAIARYIKAELDEKFSDNDTRSKNFVLIIDEINRGNISRIFGELITLLEASKRQGAEEELSVTLPYSKEEFSVPSNVYIIGTMNSSDRSLTGLDIALRRRFTFVEMPPKPELLIEIEVEGVNVGELLKIINQRIEVLLDRDHCIGHANFMSLNKDRSREHLSAIFKQKIIPQLQEYFFDDWAKINMVLNANGMLKAKPIERSALFPNIESDSEDFFEEQKTWQLVETAFDSIASFSKIIKH